jgi:hypothetical protein
MVAKKMWVITSQVLLISLNSRCEGSYKFTTLSSRALASGFGHIAISIRLSRLDTITGKN